MLTNIQTVSEQVIILFILIGVGFIITKLKLLNQEIITGFINFVVYIVTPSNIIMSFQREFKSTLLFCLGLSFLLGFIIFFINVVIARFIIREKDESKCCVLRFAAAFPNTGYMALPLQKALLGDIGVFYGAVYVAMFHIYIWSYGVHSLDRNKGRFSVKKILLSPPIIAIVVGIILFVTESTLPEIIASPLSSLSALNTPLPMIIIGYYLANCDPKVTFKNIYVYIGSFLRLAVSPFIAILICRLFNANGAVMVACVVACSAPGAAMSTMLATKYGRNTEVAVGMTSLTTLLAIITMPVFIALAQLLA